MAAYLIADVDITDVAAFEEYRREVPATEGATAGTISGVVEQPKCWKAIGNPTA